ncbi:hypothetical protein ACFLUT_01235 [Chloroflexota bacterium]
MMSSLRETMLKLVKQDRKQEYLMLCKSDYAAVCEAARSFADDGLWPELAGRAWDPFNALLDRAMVAKREGDSDEEMRALEAAIDAGTPVPYCYERLAIIWSKRRDYELAYETCCKWFDSGHWKAPQAATTSLKLLERMEKLRENLRRD